jgi:class 3 adenylate cyclase
MVDSESTTIMFLDVVNYTRKTTKLNREGLNKLHEIFDNFCLPIFEKYNGKVIKKIGDAFLVTFKSPTNSLHCAIQLQKTFYAYNKKFRKNLPIFIRIALHHGEVLVRNNDIYGDAVNITSRIEGITKPRDVVFSESLLLNINKNEIPYTYIGSHKFKGINSPIRLFKVTQKRKKIFAITNIIRKIFLILIIILLTILIYYILQKIRI